jgi:peptidoglycan-N-acetylglucosamine deacetylase
MHLLTFDIEDWYLARKSGAVPVETWNNFESRVERNTDIILEFLAGHNQKATFFILGWVAEKYPALVREIDAHGHEIGFHSNLHRHLWEMKPDEFQEDFKRGLTAIENALGKKALYYRAPYFSLKTNTGRIFDILIQHGIKASSSTLAFGSINEKLIPNQPFMFEKDGIQLPEFPLNRLSFFPAKTVFSGSGYFRILPYFILKQLFLNSKYSNTYFHPRDFDSGVPFSEKLSLVRNFLNRTGGKTTTGKLGKIFSTIQFTTLGQAAMEMIERKNKYPVIKL